MTPFKVNLQYKIASYFPRKLSLFGIAEELQFGASKVGQTIVKYEEAKGRSAFSFGKKLCKVF